MISDERLAEIISDGNDTADEAAEMASELQRLRAALPKTADGVTIVPGMTVYTYYMPMDVAAVVPDADTQFNLATIYLKGGGYSRQSLDDVYSTREAAERAKGNHEHKKRNH